MPRKKKIDKVGEEQTIKEISIEEKDKGFSNPIIEEEASKEIESQLKVDKELMKKAEKLMEEKVKEDKIRKEKSEERKEGDTLIPLDDYVKASCYIGTKVITPNMRKFVYKRRADGIAVINTNYIDQELKKAVKFISQYKPEDWIIVCKREAGWKALRLFSELTGVRIFTKKYPAGIITNITLPDFFETEMIFVCDPWLDKNAMNDALNVKKKVTAICDTNNLDNGADVVIPANNKSNKSLGMIFYILAREYMKARGIENKLPAVEEFIGEKLEELPMKEAKRKKEKEKDIEKDKSKIDELMREKSEE
jgi:small subunit ribosomal protein S2